MPEQKPISVVINEFRINMEKCINEAHLPPAVVELILQDYYMQMQNLSKQKLMADLSQSTVDKGEVDK